MVLGICTEPINEEEIRDKVCRLLHQSPALIPFLEESCRLAFFSAEPIAHRGQREGEGKTDTVNVCVLPFPKSQSRNMSGELHKQRRRVLVSLFFSFPSFFLMRWMAEVFYCELGKNCQFRWSTESSSSLCIRFFFNKQQLTAERRAPSTGTLLKPVCLFSISLVPAVFDKKLYPGQLGSFSRGCRSQDFCFASVTAALLL